MRVFLHNECSDLFHQSPQSLLFEHGGTLTPHKIEQVRQGTKYHVIAVAGIHTREQADRMKGARLLFPRDELPQTEPDEFYVHDLLGIEAWEQGTLLGKITSSRPQGENEVITIKGIDFELDVPLVHEYVAEIDLDSRRIVLQGTDNLPRTKISRGRKGAMRV